MANLKTKTQNKQPGKQDHGLPGWVWILIVIGVAAFGYLAIRLTNQRTVSTLPAEMSVSEVAKLDPAEWFFLDVREQSEWNEGHIGWATLIPLGQLEDRQGELPQNQKIVVICRSGNRSAQGRDILLNAGFSEVTSMAGGMNDWISQGLPVVTGP
ncbi:MAG: rhodanese-like domain-containing protein [Anaerolineaceae bacterium]|jgi:rhodanese-related sulfurtransferase